VAHAIKAAERVNQLAENNECACRKPSEVPQAFEGSLVLTKEAKQRVFGLCYPGSPAGEKPSQNSECFHARKIRWDSEKIIDVTGEITTIY
jgi:hypothetical protein